MYGLVGSPVRNIEKFSKVERMIRLYVGVHDRLNDISSNKVYGVDKIVIVNCLLITNSEEGNSLF